MASHQWEKRYSFRLTDGDEELNEFLSKVPNNKRSEVIRTLLRYAFRNLMKEQKEQKQLQELKLQIEQLSKIIEENHQQVMKKLESGIVMKNTSSSDQKEKEEEKIPDNSVQDTAMAIFQTFGADMDF